MYHKDKKLRLLMNIALKPIKKQAPNVNAASETSFTLGSLLTYVFYLRIF